MTSSINSEQRNARAKLRIIVRETERVLDKSLHDGKAVNPTGLEALVALGTGLPLNDVSLTVRTYMSARADVYLARGKNGGWKKL